MQGYGVKHRYAFYSASGNSYGEKDCFSWEIMIIMGFSGRETRCYQAPQLSENVRIAKDF